MKEKGSEQERGVDEGERGRRMRLTSRSTTKAQAETNLSWRREMTPALSRIVSRRVRAEPQHDWSSRAPQSTMEWMSLFSLAARSNASV